MITFPNAKINLGLRVLRKRQDGYHDLETIFYPVPLCDILEIVAVQNEFDASEKKIGKGVVNDFNTISLRNGKKATFSVSGDIIAGDLMNNLCVKALLLFDEINPINKSINMHLHKIIPSGAGLGGGSADAAFTLKMLNELIDNRATEKDLLQLASKLGSDCAFFLINQPAFATGRGEVLNKIDISLKGKYIVLVKPACSVSTPEAFSGIKPYESSQKLIDQVAKPFSDWQQFVKNDFEESVFNIHPSIKELKQQLMNSGAVFCSMSGSGSAVFGLFNDDPGELTFPENYFVFKTLLT